MLTNRGVKRQTVSRSVAARPSTSSKAVVKGPKRLLPLEVLIPMANVRVPEGFFR